MEKAKLLKIAEINSWCPPKHTNTDAWALINKDTVGSEHVNFALTEIRPGGEAEEATHPGAEHGYFMVSGVGEAYVEGEKFMVNPNECLWIPPGAKHSIKPVGQEPIRFLVFSGR
jgi:mannose-6-phosphate isomerase-like protein (cupin superfamily)